MREILRNLIFIYANESDHPTFAQNISQDTRSYNPKLFQEAVMMMRQEDVWVDPVMISRFKRLGEAAFMLYLNLQSENVDSLYSNRNFMRMRLKSSAMLFSTHS